MLCAGKEGIPHPAKTKTNTKTVTKTKAETNTKTNTKTIPNADHLLSLGNTLHCLAKTKTDTMTNRKTSHNRDHLVTLALASKDWWWMLCAGKEGIPHPANSRRRHSPNVRPQWHLQLLCHHHDSTTKTQPLQNKEFSTHRSVQSHFIHIER